MNNDPTPQEIDEIFGTDNEWKKAEGTNSDGGDVFDFDNWTDKTSIIGLYVGRKDDVGPNKSKMYIIETNDNQRVSIWGSTLLDDRFQEININEQVKIIYLGKAKSESSGRTYRNFEVYHRPAAFTKA